MLLSLLRSVWQFWTQSSRYDVEKVPDFVDDLHDRVTWEDHAEALEALSDPVCGKEVCDSARAYLSHCYRLK
jgi:hypothetical protein